MMSIAGLMVLAAAKIVFAVGTEDNPSVVAPLSPVTSAVRFWWNEDSFHAGRRVYRWKDLGVVPTNGAAFRIDFGVIDRSGFDRRRIVLDGVIDRTASKFRLDSFGMFGNRAISNDVVFISTGDGTVGCSFFADSAAPNYVRFNRSQAVKAGGSVRIPVRAQGPSSGTASCTLTDVDGRRIYRIDGPYRDPKLGFDFRYIWTDIPKRMMHFVTDVWQDAPGCRIRLTSRDLITGKPLKWNWTIDVAPAWGEQDYAIPTDDMAPGIYDFKIEYLDADGVCVHADKARYFKPDGKAPWDGTELGNEDTVPPPWTKPVFGATTFECWNRKVTLGGAGLVSSVISAGEEVLAEPSSVILDGKPLSFDVVRVERKVSEATYHLKARGAGVKAEVRCEFDGYMRFALTFPTSARSLSWRVSGSTSVVKGIEGCTPDTAYHPVGKGVALSHDFRVDKKTAWWMNGRVGLMGGTLNLHGYHMKDLNRTGRLESSADRVTVTTSFVDSPMKAGPDRTVLFYLEPTPVKPKDREFSSIAQNRLCLWSDYMFRYYEAKYPGLEIKPAFARLRKGLEDGKRIFYYCSTSGASPESPFWGWYRQDWHKEGIGFYCREVSLPAKWREHRNWCYACPNVKGFKDRKIWGVNHMLMNSEPKMKDLYFDLAGFGGRCWNSRHGCYWRDDFGRYLNDHPMENVREIHKRCYRLVKAKNPDGTMYGHINMTRFPGDVFFDLLTMGEALASKSYKAARTYRGVLSPTYYEVFTPKMIQGQFVSRGSEKTIYMAPQFGRALSCCAGRAAAEAFDPKIPEIQTAFRHFAAYVKIHGLNIDRGSMINPEWRIYYLCDGAVRDLGGDSVHHAYYHAGDDTVALSAPGPRQLWAYHRNRDTAVLIVLNDTDSAVEQEVSVKGLSATGADVLDPEVKYDFTDGKCAMKLGPRESVFIRFCGL